MTKAFTLPPEHFELGELALQSGETLRNARLAYVTFGQLNSRRDNAVLFPTFYGGTHEDNARLVGRSRALDPEQWFIVIPNMFGNGASSSPSNQEPECAAEFPKVTLLDNVACQKRLLEARFGIERVALALGWSMGGQQAYHFAALYPERTLRLLVVCGSARTSPHNWVFLEGVKAALLADPAYAGGRYQEPPRAGLSAFGRVYAGWAYSQAFFRRELYKQLGYASPGALLDAWAADHVSSDANDLLAMLWSWQHADISDNPAYGGNLSAALGAIRARTILMPARTDLYFTPEDNELELRSLRRAELRPIESDWGHCAGGPDRNPVDTAFIEAAIRDLLAG